MPSLFPDLHALAAVCRKYGIRRLAVFGSTLSGTARPDSDIDLLVEFATGRTPGFFGLATIEDELSRLVGGRRIDLRTREDLGRHIRDRVVREARVEYAA